MPLCHAIPFHSMYLHCKPSAVIYKRSELWIYERLLSELAILSWSHSVCMRRECSFYFNLNTWNLLYCIIRPFNLFISFRFILFIYFHIHRYHFRKGIENFNIRLIAWYFHFWVFLCWWIEIHIHKYGK